MRMTFAVAVACLTVVGLSLADEARASMKKSTNIPAQNLSDALQTFAKDRDLQVVFVSDEVGNLHTGGAVGEFTAAEALTRLLNGTGLTYRFLDEQTITVQPIATSSTSPIRPRGVQQPGAASAVGGNGADGAQKRSFWDRFRLAQVDQGASVSSAASSQTTDGSIKLEEILVTAQKRDERLQDVPVPVTAISANTLSQTNQFRLQDYFSSVPGLNFSSDNRGTPTMFIRGLTTGANVTPTVAYMIDDVPFGSAVTLSVFSPAPDLNPLDLARIEVLRGPQATLYGASSLGGLIKYVTVAPFTDAFAGHFQVGTSSIDGGDGLGYNVSAGVNLPLNDRLAIRVSGYSRQDPGYIDNIQSGDEDVNKVDADGGRIAMLWNTSDSSSLRLSALFQRNKADGSSLVAPGLSDLQHAYLGGGIGGFDRRVQAYSAIWNGTFGDTKITSLTGYTIGKAADSYDVTPGFAAFDAWHQAFGATTGTAWIDADNRTKNFSQELRLEMPLGSRINWLAGAFYTKQNTDTDGGFALVDSVTFARGARVETQNISNSYKETALFTDLTFQLTDAFDVQVGGRHSHNEQTFYQILTGPAVAILTGVPSPNVSPQTRSSDDSVQYLLTPRLRISPDLMLYARFTSGYRPGGANAGGSPTIPASYEPDKTYNYEVGAKGTTWDGRLSFDTSVYYIAWRGIQLNLNDPNPPGGSYTGNAGKAKSQGIELTLQARPWSGMSASLWAVWNEAELGESFAPPPINFTAAAKGDPLPYSAKRSGAVSLEQTFPLAALTGFVGGTLSYVGQREGEFQSAFSPPGSRQIYGGYARLDARAGIRTGQWNADLFVNNLANRRGLLSGGAGLFPYAFFLIQPRTYGINVSRDF